MTTACLAMPELTKAFLETLFDSEDLIEIRILSHNGGAPNRRWLQRDEIEQAWDQIEECNATDSVYLGVNPRSGEGGSAKDVACCRCVFVDFDDGVTPDRARALIADAGLPHPSVSINSGGGTHCYWRLRESIPPELFTDLQKRLIGALGSDRSVHDVPRIMRMPGTVNRKPERNGAYCEVNHIGTERYDVQELTRALPALESVSPSIPGGAWDTSPVQGRATQSGATRQPSDPDTLRRASAYLETKPASISGQRGHNALFTAVRAVYEGFDLTREESRELIVNEFNPRCQPPWSDPAIDHKLDEVERLPSEYGRGYLLKSFVPDVSPVARGAAPNVRRVLYLPSDHTEIRESAKNIGAKLAAGGYYSRYGQLVRFASDGLAVIDAAQACSTFEEVGELRVITGHVCSGGRMLPTDKKSR